MGKRPISFKLNRLKCYAANVLLLVLCFNIFYQLFIIGNYFYSFAFLVFWPLIYSYFFVCQYTSVVFYKFLFTISILLYDLFVLSALIVQLSLCCRPLIHQPYSWLPICVWEDIGCFGIVLYRWQLYLPALHVYGDTAYMACARILYSSVVASALGNETDKTTGLVMRVWAFEQTIQTNVNIRTNEMQMQM